ncbi:2,3-diaminopropionate biosynthesis protein SbnA [Bradyrhizobium huanghuaihaiense]|uniref:Cysteine synthase A n=1 Tax=Bradyrhizobium huanghuaihaiense TaxID=990078 RepID=A0A562R5Z5_9BRAD|nr:2,3-diaminopropionate biosynthesis protein SbnA [Bradyrhizobium huanghuaihaiense]TWI63796.1 cysteine synthase A [Bradyrhizobium huanghuaihaiense]
MTIPSLESLIQDDVFYELPLPGTQLVVQLKLEGLNPAGSIKFKTALAMIGDLERSGKLRAGATIVESSSGNLGLALSLLSASLSFHFICVCDPNISPDTSRLIEAHGGILEPVTELDANGGFLGTRLARVAKIVREVPNCVWTNQYANPAAKWAHHRWTGPAIRRKCPRIDYLFVGVGTSGTAMGCAEYFRAHAPHVRIIGIDSVGSVTFGHQPQRRYLPGLGASQRPPLFDADLMDDQVMVPEADAVRACWQFQREHGFLLGASSGTVMAGIQKYADRIPPGSTIVAISPDFGDRYTSTLYDSSWVLERYPELEQPHLDRKIA